MSHFFSDFGNALSVTVHKACSCTLDARWRCERAKSPYSRLYLIREGEGILRTLTGETASLCAGTVVFVPASLEFSYRCTHLEKIFFHVSVLRPDGYDLFAGIDRIFSLPLSEGDYLRAERAVTAKDALADLGLQATVSELLLRFADSFRLADTPLPTYSLTVRRAIDYVQQNAVITLSVRDVANALFLSESTLRARFRKETGIPLGRYVDDVVFMKAQMMLADAENTVAAVGAALGFCDAFYFSRRFKQKLGKTPTAFRIGIQ